MTMVFIEGKEIQLGRTTVAFDTKSGSTMIRTDRHMSLNTLLEMLGMDETRRLNFVADKPNLHLSVDGRAVRHGGRVLLVCTPTIPPMVTVREYHTKKIDLVRPVKHPFIARIVRE